MLFRSPNVPTTGELGFPVSTLAYGGLFIRSDVPPAVISRIDSACREAVNSGAYTDMAEKQYVRATYLDRAAFGARIDADYRNVGRLLAELKLPE